MRIRLISRERMIDEVGIARIVQRLPELFRQSNACLVELLQRQQASIRRHRRLWETSTTMGSGSKKNPNSNSEAACILILAS